MPRDGYSALTVSDETKLRFEDMCPPDTSQDEFVSSLLSCIEDEEPQDGGGTRRIPDDQYADLVDDVAAIVERRLEDVLRESAGF